MKQVAILLVFVFSFVVNLDTAFASNKLLKDPLDALNARVNPLLGRDLTKEEFAAHNPYMDLDLSKVPLLKSVVLSSLVITHDFVGSLMLRLLSHHALRGTQVYIMVTKQLIHYKEKNWLLEFSKSSPNIHFYVYSNENATLWSKIQSANHVKVFLTIPTSSDEECSMVSGGRNTSDMYFYENMPSHAAFPELVQWGQKKYEWAYFDDLDLLTKDCDKVAETKTLLLSYFQKNLKKTLVNDDYLLSLPHTKELEKRYVDMINQAHVSIRILSPYLNFTDEIFQALINAKKRGVEIKIITSKSIANDYLPLFLQPAMNHSLRKILKHFNVYLYSRNLNIPHAKAMQIDESFLSVGSVNMNQRSFYHDSEFTQFLTDGDINSEFGEIFSDSYMKYSEEVDQNYKIKYTLMETVILGFEKSF